MAGSSASSFELLSELHNKMCSIKTLCLILEKCQLYDALSLLREPEQATVTLHPGNGSDTIYVPMGGDLHLECQAKGLPPPCYLWYCDNEELQDQRSSSLRVSDFCAQNEGNYYCSISQQRPELNEVFSSSVHVTILPEHPYIVQQPSSVVDSLEGDTVTLTCHALGYPLPQFQWFHENTQLDGQSSNQLVIDNIGQCHNGNYKCYAKNIGGDVWSTPTLIKVVKQISRRTVTAKIALLIANDTYQQQVSLMNPTNDVILLASQLTLLGFKVIALRNLTLIEMKNAVRTFCKILPAEAYGLFYFAGHGFEMQDKFMLPVNAPSVESFLRSDSLCEKEVIRDVLATKPQLLVILLDMCLRIPDSRENPAIHIEVPEVFTYQPQRNLIQGYATTSNLVAYERKTEVNGIYVKHLKKWMMKNLPINQILQKVSEDVASETPEVSNQQMPSRTENVVGDFYFRDSVTEHSGMEKMETEFKNLSYLPKDSTICFKNVKLEAHAKFFPYKNCFHNALEIWITNLEEWRVECEIGYQGLEVMLIRKKNVKNHLVVIIQNLQKVRIPLTLTLSLVDPKSNKLVDNGMLDLEMPLIATAHLWFPQQNEQND